jgi:hypothetical protein
MRRFKSAGHAQRFLSAHSRIHNHFQLRRHHLNANQYRTARNAAFCMWHDVPKLRLQPDSQRGWFCPSRVRYRQPDNARAWPR